VIAYSPTCFSSSPSSVLHSLCFSLALSSCIKRDSPYAFEPSLTLVPVSLLFHPFTSLASYLSLIILYHSCRYKGFCMYLRASCSAPKVHCPLSFLCVCTVVLCLEITLLHSRLPPFSFSLAIFIVRLSHTSPSSQYRRPVFVSGLLLVVDPDRWLLGGVTDPKPMCMLLHSRSDVCIGVVLVSPFNNC
jgi:hypothetical protein